MMEIFSNGNNIEHARKERLNTYSINVDFANKKVNK